MKFGATFSIFIIIIIYFFSVLHITSGPESSQLYIVYIILTKH
jgi:hypothetical protein